MSILQKQKERDPSMGYARDFVGAMESVMNAVTERGVRVIANAGGVNPPACATAIQSLAKKTRQVAEDRRGDGRRSSAAAQRARRPGARAVAHGDGRAARNRTGSRAFGERLHRLEADRRGADARRAGGDHRPLHRYRADDGADTIRVWLGRHGLRQARGWHRRRTHSRVRRTVLRRELSLRLAQHSGPRKRRVSDRRCVRRRKLRHYQASRTQAAVFPCIHGVRAARLRNGRPTCVHHARRDRRLSRPSASKTPAQTACVCSASRATRRPTSSKSRSRTALDSRRSERSCIPGPMRSTRRSSQTGFFASVSTGSACASMRF